MACVKISRQSKSFMKTPVSGAQNTTSWRDTSKLLGTKGKLMLLLIRTLCVLILACSLASDTNMVINILELF